MFSAPHVELKPECTEPHLDKLDFRHGLGQDIAVAGRGSEQHLAHQLGVGRMRHVKRQCVSGQLVRSTPVRHSLRHELRVGHNHRHALIGDDSRGACANLPHFANYTANLNAVSNLDGALEQENEATEEIARDVLQTETESHTDRADEDVEGGEVNAGALKDHEGTQRNDDVPHNGAERLAHADVEAAARQDSADEPAGTPLN